MRIIFLFLFLSLPIVSFANGLVSEIIGPKEIIADVFDASEIQVDSKIIIVSRRAKRAIAFGTVKKMDLSVSPHPALIVIEEIIENDLVMYKDLIYPASYQIMKDQKVPGFGSLSLSGYDGIPSKFKELASFGVFTSEGHTLDKNEYLVSPFQFQYGVTNNFGLKMVNALWPDGYANIGVKYRVLRNRHAKITVSSFGAYKIQSNDYILQTGGVITLPQNAKFQNHLMVNIILDPQFSDAHATKGLGLFRNSDIRNITEYITDDWNRILYGPTYNVELQTLGGTASYMWIWDTFHTSLGIATQDFSNLSFGTNGYYYVYDFFWRF